jgi:hypothetical protein
MSIVDRLIADIAWVVGVVVDTDCCLSSLWDQGGMWGAPKVHSTKGGIYLKGYSQIGTEEAPFSIVPNTD